MNRLWVCKYRGVYLNAFAIVSAPTSEIATEELRKEPQLSELCLHEIEVRELKVGDMSVAKVDIIWDGDY